ncbi:hypothetical protein MPLB_910032 [Mesorhizobium sp. ORS 3324]|nr:hypothetical protein MPLB_910032 [Mesorhizobium sp. ORS 3324]
MPRFPPACRRRARPAGARQVFLLPQLAFLVIRVSAPLGCRLAAITCAELIPLASSADFTLGVASIDLRNVCSPASPRCATIWLTCVCVSFGNSVMSTMLTLSIVGVWDLGAAGAGVAGAGLGWGAVCCWALAAPASSKVAAAAKTIVLRMDIPSIGLANGRFGLTRSPHPPNGSAKCR